MSFLRPRVVTQHKNSKLKPKSILSWVKFDIFFDNGSEQMICHKIGSAIPHPVS